MAGAFDYKAQAIAALGLTNKTRWRKPFSAAERGEPGVRLLTKGAHALTPSLIDKANSIVNVCPADAATDGTIFVVVGPGGSGSAYSNTTQIYTSVDLRTWTARTAASNMRWAICWSGAKFISGGETTVCYTSSDGITWGTGGSFPGAPGAQAMIFTFAGKVYAFPIGVGTTAYYESSNDGTSWTSRTLPNSQFFSNITYRSQVAVTNDAIYIAYGATINSVIVKTTDGVNWTTVRNEVAMGVASGNFYRDIVANGPLVVASHIASGSCIRSIDGGATWSLPYVASYSSPAYIPSAVVAGSSGVAATGPKHGAVDTTLGHASAVVNGRIGFFVQVTQWTYNTSAAATKSLAFLHSADGLLWDFEPVIASDWPCGVKPVVFGGKTYFVGFSTIWNPSTAYLQAFNPDFEELIYDYTL